MGFRPPREEDNLGSYLRRHIFRNLLQRELTFDTIFGRSNENYGQEARALLTDSDNPLSEWQDKFAPHHWQREFIHPVACRFPCRHFPLERPPGPPVIFTRLTLGQRPFFSHLRALRPLLIQDSDGLILSVMRGILPDVLWETF